MMAELVGPHTSESNSEDPVCVPASTALEVIRFVISIIRSVSCNGATSRQQYTLCT